MKFCIELAGGVGRVGSALGVLVLLVGSLLVLAMLLDETVL